MEPPKNYFIDMDGVLVRGGAIIPGADRFKGEVYFTSRWPHQDTPAPGFNMPTLG